MKVACPNCGAENPLDNPGQEVVCISCFSVWVPEPGSEITETASVGVDEAEDTYQGHTINIEPQGQEIDPLTLDLGDHDLALALDLGDPDLALVALTFDLGNLGRHLDVALDAHEKVGFGLT